MADSTQHKLKRVRPPRVQISYDVETGSATQSKELPLVVGVMSDLSGDNKEKPALSERSFAEVQPDTVDSFVSSVAPKLNLKVEDKLSGREDSELGVSLNFKKVDDFSPMGVVEQVPALWQLYQTRTQMVDLMAKLDGNDKLNDLLAEVAERSEYQSELRGSLGLDSKDEKQE